MAIDDVLKQAKALVAQGKGSTAPRQIHGKELLTYARNVLVQSTPVVAPTPPRVGLDVYIAFDTTGSMDKYREAVRRSVSHVSDELYSDSWDIRIAPVGVGDHCDGNNWFQMPGFARTPAEFTVHLDSIVDTHGGDEPEAYECGAKALAKSMPKESEGRKTVVVFVGDSIPHGMKDDICPARVDYKKAFARLGELSDAFYFVGCEPGTYELQRQLVKNPGQQFIELGSMADALPPLIIALVKATISPVEARKYLSSLGSRQPQLAQKVYKLLPP